MDHVAHRRHEPVLELGQGELHDDRPCTIRADALQPPPRGLASPVSTTAAGCEMPTVECRLVPPLAAGPPKPGGVDGAVRGPPAGVPPSTRAPSPGSSRPSVAFPTPDGPLLELPRMMFLFEERVFE